MHKGTRARGGRGPRKEGAVPPTLPCPHRSESHNTTTRPPHSPGAAQATSTQGGTTGARKGVTRGGRGAESADHVAVHEEEGGGRGDKRTQQLHSRRPQSGETDTGSSWASASASWEGKGKGMRMQGNGATQRGGGAAHSPTSPRLGKKTTVRPLAPHSLTGGCSAGSSPGGSDTGAFKGHTTKQQ